jgi:hypothetical protein
MHRIIGLIGALGAGLTLAVALVGSAGGASGATMDQAKAAGWDCNPEVLIIGYYHCAPPGKPSVADLIAGTDVPTIVLRVFYADGDRTFAGIETLIRADLYRGQACPQDGLAQWGFFDLPTDYFACHRFDT